MSIQVRKVIEYPVKLAERVLFHCVLTFSNATLTPKQGRSFKCIYTDEQKSRILKSLGIIPDFEVDFNNVKIERRKLRAEFLTNKLNAGWLPVDVISDSVTMPPAAPDELIELGSQIRLFESSVADDVKYRQRKVSQIK